MSAGGFKPRPKPTRTTFQEWLNCMSYLHKTLQNEKDPLKTSVAIFDLELSRCILAVLYIDLYYKLAIFELELGEVYL